MQVLPCKVGLRPFDFAQGKIGRALPAINTRYFLPARVYAISMVFFSWPPWVSYHSIIM